MNLMRVKPQEAWAMARKLEAGHNSHHRTNQVLNFSKDGVKLTNNKENLNIICKHLEQVYNRELLFDPSIINEVEQRPENLEFNQLPTIEELDNVITSMATLAAPGESVFSPITLKMLPREARLIMLVDIIHHYWNSIDDNPEWNKALLCILYKKKGK
jgi:hypothetical protein